MQVRVEFMGVIADLAGVRELALDFPRLPSLRELLAELERRFGPDFAARIYRTSTAPRLLQMCARIFVNGSLVDDRKLDEPLPAVGDRPAPEVLVFILPAACGG